jgi:hypothetical protein
MWSVLAIALVLAILRSDARSLFILLAGLSLASIAAVYSPAFTFFLWQRATDRLVPSTNRVKGRLDSLAGGIGPIACLTVGLVIGFSIGGLLVFLTVSTVGYMLYFD